MYDLRFVSDTGKELVLNYDSGIVVGKVDGATGMTVTQKTAQGYKQVGVTISALTVGGRDLLISGFIFEENAQKKQELISTFAPFVTGRLYWEDRYWIDVAVKNAPTVYQEKDSRFSMRLFAADPYFRSTEQNTAQNGITTNMFSFPLIFSGTTIGTDRPHQFGVQSTSGTFNVPNNGQAETPFDLEIEGTVDITSPQLTDSATGAFLLWNGTIAVGEKLRIWSESGRIRATLTDTNDEVTNVLGLIDDDSTLFSLPVGDNILEATAETAEQTAAMRTTISYYTLYSGVLMNGV
ncbi:MAG: phage tail family protein [Clostridia bacterium]|nr:phage tail family protein [Clostridia bacterium]MBQ6127089.1 phage tail family protein [Candidatus Saccharibacteria bacterium]MBQ6127142.1 phage tail family protein [Candidatus Saccharibacteria bacterium]